MGPIAGRQWQWARPQVEGPDPRAASRQPRADCATAWSNNTRQKTIDSGYSDWPAKAKEPIFSSGIPSGEGPCARGGHTATPGPRALARIIIFGGHYDGGSNVGFVYLNDTHVLDIDENIWTVPRCRGTAPEPRYGHAAALVGSRVVYFGGKGKTGCFRDLHALDTSNHTWFQGPSSGGAPSARHGHTANLHGTRLYVFGGTCSGKYFGDLHCLDLASMAWSCPPATGPKPTPRCGHTALLIGESLIIHGGFCMESPDIATKELESIGDFQF
ncbi:unnamed protein product [Effrenium voratum]|nr:unnamed protein product [Effrenium voratum]